MAVFGSTLYPPAIGFLSVTVGLTIAMFGNAVLALASAAALVAFGRLSTGRSADPVPDRLSRATAPD